MEILIKGIIVVLTVGTILLLYWVSKNFSSEKSSNILLTFKNHKKTIIIIFVVIVVCSFTLIFTNSFTDKLVKDSYVNNFEAFIEEVRIGHKDYSKSEWNDIEEEYLDLSKNRRLLHEEVLTKDDKKTLIKFESQYLSFKADEFISNFEAFIEEVRIGHKDYSKSEWKDVEEEYLDLSKNRRLLHEEVLTKDDKKTLSKFEGQYLSFRTSGFLGNIINSTKDIIDNAVEYIDGFLNSEGLDEQNNKTIISLKSDKSSLEQTREQWVESFFTDDISGLINDGFPPSEWRKQTGSSKLAIKIYIQTGGELKAKATLESMNAWIDKKYSEAYENRSSEL